MARLPKRPPRHRPHTRPSRPPPCSRTHKSSKQLQAHSTNTQHNQMTTTKTMTITSSQRRNPTQLTSTLPGPSPLHVPQPRRMDHDSNVQDHHKPRSPRTISPTSHKQRAHKYTTYCLGRYAVLPRAERVLLVWSGHQKQPFPTVNAAPLPIEPARTLNSFLWFALGQGFVFTSTQH